jgi:hypothetical protein
MKNCTLIQLTEISKKGQDLTETPCLINTEAIVSVFEAELEDKDIPIIGVVKIDNKLRQIALVNGRALYVRETLDEILAKTIDATA